MTVPTGTRTGERNAARVILGTLILLIGVAWMLEIAGAVDDLPWSYLLPAAVIVIGIGLVADSRGPTHGGLVALAIKLNEQCSGLDPVSLFNVQRRDLGADIGTHTYLGLGLNASRGVDSLYDRLEADGCCLDLQQFLVATTENDGARTGSDNQGPYGYPHGFLFHCTSQNIVIG